ncbi:hypothetical protein NDN08_001919 [Rhodosorus marinus]|uniref:Myb-like domain-containing protein n=1 Tax=Rhodosorus marinus TaxID=101924 RepID=A0AAV8UWK2_9RHOD|nr:hypothetical protein NDN08_001919 [Rhodosorus marinus]
MAEDERNVHFEFVALDFLATEISYVKLMLTGVSKLGEVFADDEEYHQMLLRRMWTTWLIQLREALEEYQENGCEIEHFPAELLETGTDFGSMDEAFSKDDFPERRKLYRVLVDLESIFWLDQLTAPDLFQDWSDEVEDKYLSTEPTGDLYRSLRRIRCEDFAAMMFDGEDSAYKRIRQVKKRILNVRSLLAFVDKIVGSSSNELDAPVLVKAMKRYRHYKSFNEDADEEVPRLSSRPLRKFDKRHGTGRYRGLRELDGKRLVHGGENGVNSDESTDSNECESGFANLKMRKRERSAQHQKKRTRPGADTSDDDDEGDGSSIGREGRRHREAHGGDTDGPNLKDLKKEWRLSKGKLPLKAITGKSYEDAYSLMSAKQKQLATHSETRITEELKEASSKLKSAIGSKGDQDPLDRALRKLPASITNEEATQKSAPRRSRRLSGAAADENKGDDAKAGAAAGAGGGADAEGNEKQEDIPIAAGEGNARGVEAGADGDEMAEEEGQEIRGFSSDEENSGSESEARAAERLEASKGLKRPAGRASKEHNKKMKTADSDQVATRAHGRGILYTTEEDAMLVSGLRNFGWGRWAAIRNAGKFHPTRTTTSLKDRARNLKLHSSDYPEQD